MAQDQELGDIIIDYLSSNNDKLFTATALYNEITTLMPSLQIKDTHKRTEFIEKFKIEFLTLENKYKGVHRFIINERQYIIWSNESYDKLYETHIKNTQETNTNSLRTETPTNTTNIISNDYINTEIETTDYYQMTKSYINSREKYKYIYDDIRIDGINNAIHLFVINNDIQNLRNIDKDHTIDWTIRNRNNKSCLELARENKNCEMIEYILTNIHDKTILNLKNIMESQKSVQKEIYDKSNIISIENVNLVKENQQLKTTNHELEVKYGRLLKFILFTGISVIYMIGKKILSDH